MNLIKHLVCAMSLLIFTIPSNAQNVIVVLKDNQTLQSYSGISKLDTRMQSNTRAWGYVQPSVVGAMQSLESAYAFKARHAYSNVLKGFSADLTAAQIASLKTNALVASITNAIPVYAIGQSLPWGIDRVDADLSFTKVGDGKDSVSNVNVYVIDTGADATHPDLNVVEHLNFTADGNNYDCHGHGTHVSGTIAAKDDGFGVVGVAPGAPLTALKVLDCNGSGWNTDVIKAIDWLTSNRKLPAVANMSLGGGVDPTEDAAVVRSVTLGNVFYALAAGNSASDACNYSPARSGKGNNGIVTTAATDSSNAEAYFSNYGACVDIWAPGVDIKSTYPGNRFASMNGTSMASPHVAGSGALFLSLYPNSSPVEVENFLKTKALATSTKSKDGAAIKIDNVASLSTPSPAQPDFVIGALSISPTTPEANASFTASVTVKNQGTASGTVGTVQVWANQTTAQACSAVGDKSTTVGSLAAGASTTVTISGLTADSVGAKTLRAYVDSNCQTAESNEANNQTTLSYNVVAPVVYKLTVTPSQGGRIASNPNGIDCGTICSADFTRGTQVGLTANPMSNFAFLGWGGACSGTGACNVTMDVAKNVTADFKPIAHSLTVTVTVTGKGTVTSNPIGINCAASCTSPFNQGASVNLTASPQNGFVFAGWTGACVGTTTCTVTMDSAKNVNATFSPTSYPLLVTVVGYGSVTSTPTGINCGVTCSSLFNPSQTVTLTATPNQGYVFANWTGDQCSGNVITCTVTMNAAKSITATFNPGPWLPTVIDMILSE